ncbi:hypothetical protein DdX_15365 [Ditylenchus destructor]|uniref:FLYWCH-type domain-containing protein n=1 Tax=Ditylenchus destructor TaxID=166010 RepID=A0AAD4MRM6_9BILA|nr:hypothetical protein DdX_15365 [Ditylenchus destructor]
MASTREQLQLLQKAQKRARVQTADDDSILEEETVDEHAEEDTTASHDQENKQPVQFQRGTTNQGNICLWYREFRYVRTRKNGIWFRCEQRSCKASLLLQDVENLTGILGPNEHNHIAAPSRQQAETSRHGMKQQIHANPRARPFRLRAQGRADVDDEVFERMGTDEALDRMIARVKNKTFRNVNRANPLEIQIPPELLMKDGESTLVYDSRITRPNQADVVLVFSHGKAWLGYFAKNFIGLTQLEKDRGAAAFDPLRVFLRRSRSTERFSTPSTIATPSPIATLSSMLSRQSRSSLRSANPLNATLPSRPSTLSSRSSFQLVQRWDMEIVQKPRYAIPFWNVFNRTQNAIERTNNGMEAAHKYFAKDLNHHPSLSDYLAALLSDVDKQVDTARAVRLQHSRARLTRNVIKEQHVTNILDAANFDTDEGLIDAVHLLGLVMQGFVDGLRVPNEDEEENETSEEE